MRIKRNHGTFPFSFRRYTIALGTLIFTIPGVHIYLTLTPLRSCHTTPQFSFISFSVMGFCLVLSTSPLRSHVIFEVVKGERLRTARYSMDGCLALSCMAPPSRLRWGLGDYFIWTTRMQRLCVHVMASHSRGLEHHWMISGQRVSTVCRRAPRQRHNLLTLSRDWIMVALWKGLARQ